MIPFGKVLRVGNFCVLKKTKSLTKEQVKQLRTNENIPPEVSKEFSRSGLPYIQVYAISDCWKVEFACTMNMFRFIDSMKVYGFDNVQCSNKAWLGNFTEESQKALTNLFNMMFADSTTVGDPEYWVSKNDTLSAYLQREIDKHKEISDEDDAKILKEEQAKFEANQTSKEMANEISKED